MAFKRWTRCALGSTVLLVGTAGTVAATPPSLYHSPSDDGVSGGIPASVPFGESVTVHLYLGIGSNPSTGDPCHQGDGDEFCGFRLGLVGSGVNLQSFTPAEADTLYSLTPGRIDLTGGNFQAGDLGPTKLGDLVIDGPAAGGTLDLVVGQYVDTRLTKVEAGPSQTIVALPEPNAPLALAFGVALLLALRRLSSDRGRS